MTRDDTGKPILQLQTALGRNGPNASRFRLGTMTLGAETDAVEARRVGAGRRSRPDTDGRTSLCVRPVHSRTHGVGASIKRNVHLSHHASVTARHQPTDRAICDRQAHVDLAR